MTESLEEPFYRSEMPINKNRRVVGVLTFWEWDAQFNQHGMKQQSGERPPHRRAFEGLAVSLTEAI